MMGSEFWTLVDETKLEDARETITQTFAHEIPDGVMLMVQVSERQSGGYHVTSVALSHLPGVWLQNLRE